jgi:uncharacterized protein
MSNPLTCLVISDGRRGIENQALGLAEALAQVRKVAISKHVVRSSKQFQACPPKIQLALKSTPADYGIAALPGLAIGCGRQAIAPLLALKKAGGRHVYTVYIQDPRIDPKHFDLVIAPEHDGLTGENVRTIIGSPNRVTGTLLAEQVLHFAVELAKAPAPRVAVLIGGTSKTHTLSRDMHREHRRAISTLVEQDISVMLSTSRRTPGWAREDYCKRFFDRKQVWLWDSARAGQGDNPYFAFLGAADAILVTEDSTNMLTESCATGKPVFTLPMAGTPRKFSTLYSSLQERCHVVPFTGAINASSYQPLNETVRLAEIIRRHLGKN